MTDQEIIKALECCSNSVMCESCAIFGTSDCMTKLYKYALDLIARQQAEIERLRAKNQCFPDLGITYSEIRAEAVREFAEKLKANARKGAWEVREYIEPDDIDNLVKGMVGEQ